MPSVQDRLRIVHLEDDPGDAALIEAVLAEDGFPCVIQNVASRATFVAALEAGPVGLILSDFALPSFDGLAALRVARSLTPETPFILVSGTMGEEAAIESLRGGATDYVLKHRLTRLGPAVRRAVEEAAERRTRRAAEEALAHDQQFLRALLDSLDTGVVACDADGMLTFFNRAARELHGLPCEPVQAEDWSSHSQLYASDGLTPLASGAVPLRRALGGEHLRHAECIIRHRDGTAREVVASGQPIVDDLGKKFGAVVALQDVSERKKLEQQFRQAQKMEAMGRLAAGVAHDFNNVLTVISGYCELASRRLPPVGAARRELDEIAKAGERAANLTRQLLAFSRQQVLELRVLDVNDVVSEMDKMLERLIGAHIRLTFKPGADLGHVRADAGQIQQVVMNLVVNARDAMDEGGLVTIETSNVEVGPYPLPRAAHAPGTSTPATPEVPAGSYVKLSVADSGCGMDADTVARIFEPFFTTKEVGRGTGLGLSTVHGIVTQSRGFVTVETVPGRGSTFHVFLPRLAEEVDSAAPTLPQFPGGGSETILVVDDDGALLGLMREVLALHGYAVIHAGTAESALAKLDDEARGIDALVTDVVMPGLGGRQLYERLQALRPGLPTVFMSGYLGDDIDPLGSILGARVGFVQKPFRPEELLAKLREVLNAPDAAAA